MDELAAEDEQLQEICELNEELVLECTGEGHLGDVDTLLLRGRGLRSLSSLASMNLPSLQTVLVSNNSIGPGLGGVESLAYALTSLNINNNHVEDLSALRGCANLESLYAACNRIRDIRPLHSCTQLRQVSLYANLMSSLEACTDTLLALRLLSELDLGNNPCAFADEYKHKMILSLPWLCKLDGDQVGTLDHDLARHYYHEKGKPLPASSAPVGAQELLPGVLSTIDVPSSKGGADILVIHGDGSPPGHKMRADGENWVPHGDEHVEADVASEDRGSSREACSTPSGTALFSDEKLNDHPVLLQYLAESSLEEATAGDSSGCAMPGRRRPRSFVQRLRKTAEVMEQTAVLPAEALAGRHNDNGLGTALRPGNALRPGTPAGCELARPSTAAVLHDVLGQRDTASRASSWADAEPRETIRQLLRVVADLKAENRELNQASEQSKRISVWGAASEASQQLEQLRSENANMYHLVRENKELQEQVRSLQDQLGGEHRSEPPRPTAQPEGYRWNLGDIVEADYMAEGDWYKGEVLFDHGNGTFDIGYEDGDKEVQVPWIRIRGAWSQH